MISDFDNNFMISGYDNHFMSRPGTQMMNMSRPASQMSQMGGHHPKSASSIPRWGICLNCCSDCQTIN